MHHVQQQPYSRLQRQLSHCVRFTSGHVDLTMHVTILFVSVASAHPLCRSKVKIDYQPRAIRVGALQNGDYLELLNLFPLEGVHLTLQKLLLTGVSGWNSVTQLLLQVLLSWSILVLVQQVSACSSVEKSPLQIRSNEIFTCRLL